MKRSIVFSGTLVLLLLALSCRSKDANTDAAPKPVESQALPAPPAPKRTPLEIPTQEDFEVEATEQITSKNLEDELDRLEKELKAL